MHVTIDLDVLDDLVAVGLEAAVEVVEVVDAADLAGGGVEQLGGDGLRQGVVALLFVARHEVVAVAGDHAVELGNLVGRVLEVGVHGDDHVALGACEAGVEGGRLAVVAAECDSFYGGIFGGEALDYVPRRVGGAVVDENDLV